MKTDSFGKHLRELRGKKGVGLRTAARELHISPAYLSRIEQGHVEPPRVHIINRIGDYYDVDADSLIRRARNRRYGPIAEDTEKQQTKVELYALYRAVQELQPELLFELLQQVYEGQGKSEKDIEKDLDRLRLELLRLPKGREGLLADRLRPRFLSKAILEQMAEKSLAEVGLAPEVYTPATPIEEIVDRPGRINLVLSDKWDGKHSEDEPRVLAMSRWSKNFPGEREVVVSAKLFESPERGMRTRLNFTLAHEYFHVIEHLCLMGERGRSGSLMRSCVLPPQLSPSVRRIKPSIRRRGLRHWVDDNAGPRKLSTDEDWREWQANYFAACLLMPSLPLRKEFSERFGSRYIETPCGMRQRQYALEVATTIITREYICDKALCSMFAVGAQAMAIRLMELGLVI